MFLKTFWFKFNTSVNTMFEKMIFSKLQEFSDLISYLITFLEFETYQTCELYKICGYNVYFNNNQKILESLNINNLFYEDIPINVEFIKFLIKNNIQINDQIMNCASRNGHLEVVKYLHSIGVKCTVKAMDWASEHGHLEVVKYLHSIGAKCGIDAIDRASLRGHLEVIKYLCSNGAKDTEDAINNANKYGHVEVAKYLYSIKANCITDRQFVLWYRCLEIRKYSDAINAYDD